MRQDQQAYEDIQFLTGSPQRRNLLSALCDAPGRPCELGGRVEATRTTIHRILAGFLDRQWAVKRDGEYQVTVTGRRMWSQYERLLSEAERAREFGPFAANLGPVADELPASALESGQLTGSSDGDPLAPVSRLTEWFRATDGDVYAVSPIVAEPFNEAGAELLESGVEIEYVIDRSVLERSRERYAEELALGRDHDRIDIYVHSDPLEIGIVVDDSRCCVVAYDDEGNIHATLEASDGATRAWAMDAYERRRERAEPIEAVFDDRVASNAD